MITQDGKYTVNAYMIDSSGNESGMSNVVAFTKDTVAPTTANLYVNTTGTTSIGVMAMGADATSGVKSYQFQKSTTSATSGFSTVTTITTNAGTCSCTYTGLTRGTTYYLRVIVTDNRGLTKTSTANSVETAMISKADIGKAVTIDLGSGSYSVPAAQSGHSAAQTVTYDGLEETNDSWVVWDVVGERVELTCTDTIGFLYLKGANGVNNANYLLDQICRVWFENQGYVRAYCEVSQVIRYSLQSWLKK